MEASRPDVPASSVEEKAHAFLLGQLADRNSASKGELNKGISPSTRKTLGLTTGRTNEIRSELVANGYLELGAGRSGKFRLTTAGTTYLASLPRFETTTRRAPAINEAEVTDETRLGQRTFLLLQLLDAKDQKDRLSKADANKIPKETMTRLDLTIPKANKRRDQLAELGFVAIHRVGRATEYELTRDGLEYLVAGGRHLDRVEFKISGRTLNRLIEIAKEKSFERPETPTPVERSVSTPELAEAVLREFEELRRERHGFSGLVPIHEARMRIAENFGPTAARHDAFDDAVFELRQSGRLRLVAISDLSKATSEQLNASIPGNSETLFYLEAALEHPVAR
jgi:predicted transcriptional regulator